MSPRGFWVATILLALGASSLAAAQGDRVTVVELVTVGRGEAPLPKVGRPQPNLSPEQVAGALCTNQNAGVRARVTNAALRDAFDATLRAQQVRKEAFSGKASDAQMAQAEVARQNAVAFLKVAQRVESLPPQGRNGLTINRVSFSEAIENGRKVLVVRGTAHNANPARTELPPVVLYGVDVNGFMLAGQMTPLQQVYIEAGADLTFSMRFKNPPAYAEAIIARFAPPYGVREERGCDFIDPLKFDPSDPTGRNRAPPAGGPPPVPIPSVGQATPAYNSSELADIEALIRRAAVQTLNQRRPLPCEPPDNPRWRTLLVLADRLDEAWTATNTAEEIRRDAARGIFIAEDVTASELARQVAVRAMIAAQPPKPGPMPKYDNLAIENYKVRRENTVSGDSYVASGVIRNRASAPAAIPPLRFAALDRFGYAMAEQITPSSGTIPALGSRAFQLRMNAPPVSLVAQVEAGFAC